MCGCCINRMLRFGPFELSIGERVLRRDREVLPLGGRALNILIHLAERPGEIVGKKELIDHVWPDVTVAEGNLRVQLAAIRKALGDGQHGNRYIANIQGRGYSFVGSVVSLENGAVDGSDRRRSVGRLPRALPMIGRRPVLREVQDGIRESRFITLLGPGGVGKTTIAIAAGHAMAGEFGGEIYFVDLGSLTDPRHVAAAIGISLGLAPTSNDAAMELVDFARSKRLLIILDNCEHVIEAVAPFAENLFQETTSVHLLATSRELLRVEGERCYRVLPLAFPQGGSEQTADEALRYPAVQLFVERVAARAGTFVLTDGDASFVAEICRKLDGLPLAIELAAGRAAALGIGETAARLVSRLELLKLGDRTAVARRQTLRSTLDWSYDLLSDLERIVFRRIGIFVGQFTLEEVGYIAGERGTAGGEIFDAIAGLAKKSLIATSFAGEQPQYRLLDITRAYALEKLEKHAEFDLISFRHAEYIAESLESQRETLSALPKAERAACYSSQLGNVRAALEWSFGSHGNDEIATRLAVASTQLFMKLSLLIEWQGWAEQAIGLLEDQHKNSRHDMEVCASLPLALMNAEGSDPHVRSASSRALDVALMQQDLAHELRLLSGLFMYSSWTTDIHRALDVAARIQKLALKTQDPDDLARAESMLGAANHLAGNHLVAQRHFEAGLRHSASGSRLRPGHYLFHHTTLLLVGMARSLLYRGGLDQSLDYARLAIEEGEKSGHPRHCADS